MGINDDMMRGDMKSDALIARRLLDGANRPLALFELVANNMSEGVAVADAHGQLVYFNPVAEKLLGKGLTTSDSESWSEYYGLFYEDKVTPIPTDQLPMVHALGGRYVEKMIVFVRNKNRPEGLFISCGCSPIKDDDGEIHGGLVVFQDITEEKETLDALKATETRLRSAIVRSEEANKAKSDFLAQMSHEIRTPLGAILGFTEMLLEAPTLSEEHRDLAESVRRNGSHLLTLVDNVLGFSKIEAVGVSLEKKSFVWVEEIRDTILSFKQQAQLKGIRFEVEFASPVPKTIYSSATGLRQILLNIIGNAFKFTKSGTVLLRIGTRGDLLSFEVIDTGIGISKEQQEKLFKPFVQADGSTSRRYGGTGLGLVLSRRISENLGGELRLEESVPGKGSRFAFTVDPGPLKSVPRLSNYDFEAKPTEENKRRDSSRDLEGSHVLLVEDSVDNQVLLRHFLEQAGAEVRVANDGQMGVALALKEDFDIILMDIQMPELDGYMATKRLRKSGCKLPIVALTAHAMAGERLRCQRAGCDDYISKPVNYPHLIASMQNLLQQN